MELKRQALLSEVEPAVLFYYRLNVAVGEGGVPVVPQ